MKHLQIKKYISIPDKKIVERNRKVPELGPSILFFSGGSALRHIARKLVEYTHNSIHIITPFDSGGSSAVLRKEFDMLSIGDIRNRLMALADQSYSGNPDIYRLFSYRFPKSSENSYLEQQLSSMLDGKHPLVAAVQDPLRKIIRNHLQYFASEKSVNFDLRGASIGNLILAGGYLNNRRQIDPVIYLFSKLVEARGIVRPCLNCDYQLAARLKNGKVVVGQHLITGKEVEPLASPVDNLFLVASMHNHEPVQPTIREKMKTLIRSAELICYPPGSFYSSLICNFLPEGVVDAIAANPALKVYIPNLGPDPEQNGMSCKDSVEILIKYLQSSCDGNRGVTELLNYVIVDLENTPASEKDSLSEISRMGVQIIDTPLVSKVSKATHDPELFSEVLLSLT